MDGFGRMVVSLIGREWSVVKLPHANWQTGLLTGCVVCSVAASPHDGTFMPLLSDFSWLPRCEIWSVGPRLPYSALAAEVARTAVVSTVCWWDSVLPHVGVHATVPLLTSPPPPLPPRFCRPARPGRIRCDGRLGSGRGHPEHHAAAHQLPHAHGRHRGGGARGRHAQALRPAAGPSVCRPVGRSVGGLVGRPVSVIASSYGIWPRQCLSRRVYLLLGPWGEQMFGRPLPSTFGCDASDCSRSLWLVAAAALSASGTKRRQTVNDRKHDRVRLTD